MKGRAFLKSAQDLLAVGGEHNWRTALGRAYYALVHESADALLRWHFPKPPGEQIHRFVRLRFDSTPHSDFRPIGLALDQLGRFRNHADYQLSQPGVFANDIVTGQATRDATDAIAHLEAIEADSARLAAAVAALRHAWPEVAVSPRMTGRPAPSPGHFSRRKRGCAYSLCARRMRASRGRHTECACYIVPAPDA